METVQFLFFLFFCLIFSSLYSLKIRRIELGDRIIVPDNEEIKKPFEDIGQGKDGMDMRFANCTEDSLQEFVRINDLFDKMKILKTLENKKCSINYKINFLNEYKDIFNDLISDVEAFDVLAGGLGEDIEDFLNNH